MKNAAFLCALFCTGLVSGRLFSPLFSADGAVSKKAVPATVFLNSIGVNSAISARGETLEKTIEALNYTGIRWIRSGYEAGVPLRDIEKVHVKTGAKLSYGLLSGGADISRLLSDGRKLDEMGALLAFEGPNEPNNWALTYRGKNGGKNSSWKAVAGLQRDLYTAVKRDPQLGRYPVWSLSENGAQTDNTGLQFLTIPADAGTDLPAGTAFADFANCHNYFMHPSHPGLYDNQTWNAADPGPGCKVDGLYGNYGKTWAGKFSGYPGEALEKLPRVTTETGATIGSELSERKQACMILNMYLAQFARGWAYTALYLLRDRTDETGNQAFGLYKPDYTPRLSAKYLHNLTRILADQGQRKNPGEISYTIAAKPETVHDLLLQKSDGSFWLLIWDEKVTGKDTVMLRFPDGQHKLELFDPTVAEKAIMHFPKRSARKLILSDHPLILKIS